MTAVVTGFKSGFDWLPTQFVRPFAPHEMCSVCEMVPLTLFFLPCGHRLCHECFYRDETKREYCPLDKCEFKSDQLASYTWDRQSFLELWINCWNADNGCKNRGSSSAVLHHFNTACQFHTARCPRCRKTMLHRHIADHLVSGCETRRPYAEQPVRDNAGSDAFEKVLSLGRMADPLELVWDRNSAVTASPTATSDPEVVVQSTASAENNEPALTPKKYSLMRKHWPIISRATKDTSKPGLPAANTNTLASTAADSEGTSAVKPTPATAAVQETVPENPAEQDTTELFASCSDVVSRGVVDECCECTIENWSSFSSGKAGAIIRNGRCDCDVHRSAYGYILVPSLARNFFSVTVHAFVDSNLTTVLLPPVQRLGLRFVHPGDSSKDITRIEQVSWFTCPMPSENIIYQLHVGHLKSFCLTAARLQKGGFVADDKLRIRFKLLS